jgi:hypothetical protein
MTPSLPYTPQSLAVVEKVACEGHEQLPWPEILEALVAVRWETAFVSVYRCVEFLFSMTSVRSLRDALCPGMDLFAVSQAVEEHLAWRAMEEDAMSLLFRNVKGVNLDSLKSIQMKIDGNNSGDLGKFVYRKLRNPIVHLRPAYKKGFQLDAAAWNTLFCSFLEITDTLYSTHLCPKLRPGLL